MPENDKKKVYAAALGGLDSLLEEGAKKIASSIASQSPLRGRLFRTALGVVNGFVEAVAGDLPPVAGALLEKGSDFFDFLGEALTGTERREEKIAKVKDWMESFFSSAGERLTKSPNPKEEFEKIKLEFELRRELLKIIEEATKAKEPEKPAPKEFNFEEWKKKFSDQMAKYRPKLIATDKKIADEIWKLNNWLAKKGVR